MSRHGLDVGLKPKRFRLLFVAFVAGTMLLLWSAYGISSHFIRKNLEQGLKTRLQREALLLEEHSSRALDSVVARLSSVAAFTTAQALRSQRLSPRMLHDLVIDTPVLRSLSLVDAGGRVVASSEAAYLGLVLKQDALPAPGPDGTIFYGGVFPARDLPGLAIDASAVETELSLWLIGTSVTLEQEPHRWLAVLNPGYFQNLWTRVNPEPGDLTGLYDYNGQRLISSGHEGPNAFALSQVLSDKLSQRELGLFELDRNARWQVAYRGSTLHPVVMVTLSDRDLLLTQAVDERLRLLLALLGTLLVAAISAWLFRWYLRYEASITELANQTRAIGAHLMVSEADPEGRITYANLSMLQHTGYQEAELIGQNHRIFSSGYHPADYYERLWQTVSAGQIWKGLFRNRAKAGAHYWVNATIVPFTDAWGKVTRYVCLYSDITEAITLSEQLEDERQLRKELAHLNDKLLTHANTDPLTGLSNRRGFEHFAQQALAASRQFARPMSALILDLDHFKQVNDHYGHAAGDAVLQEMARRWNGLIRSSDLLARLGGEEFCLLLPNTPLRQAQLIAEKLRQACTASPVPWSDGDSANGLAVTVSIGMVSSEPLAAIDLDSLLHAADQALYAAKRGGRNRVVAWTAGPAPEAEPGSSRAEGQPRSA